jgi:hypothetical protein
MPRTEREIEDLAATYFSYVSRRLFHLVGVRRPQGSMISFTLVRLTLLAFEVRDVQAESTSSRITYHIIGGLLAQANRPFGTLSISTELRDQERTMFCLEVAEYHPRLAQYVGGAIFKLVQSPIHQWLGDGFVTWAVSRQWRFEEDTDAG